MTNSHPLGWIPENKQRRVFIVLFIFTIALMLVMTTIGEALINETAPSGIISFELAGDLESAQQMIDSWNNQSQIRAGLSLGLDYLFLVAYAAAISLGCALVARNLSFNGGSLGRVGYILAWLLPLAALLDTIENYALIRLLFGSEQGYWPSIARWTAIPKFVIIILGLVFFILGLTIVVIRRYRGNDRQSVT
jgi:preprotein translocase subunit SecG